MKVLCHSVVYHHPERFAGWPANHGLWQWSDGEVVIGFLTGIFTEQAGHNLQIPYLHHFARTTDEGINWQIETPSFPHEQVVLKPFPPSRLPLGANVMLRFLGEGYHGSSEGRGGFLMSLDRGKNWEGPFSLDGLTAEPRLREWEITARTDTLVPVPGGFRTVLSARRKGEWGTDKPFMVHIADSDCTLTFLDWVVSPDDPYRAVMPATVALSEKRLVTALRRRQATPELCWIDLYASENGGNSWKFRSTVGDTGGQNGNPPALVRLPNGQLCCAYGNRTRNQMIVRLSGDEGRTWLEEAVIRDDFVPDAFGDNDFGYPQMFVRRDGRLVTVYYWSTAARREHHIAATLWEA